MPSLIPINLDKYIEAGHGSGRTFEYLCEKSDKSKIPYHNPVRDFITQASASRSEASISLERQLHAILHERTLNVLQRQKFAETIARIDEGTENFYPPEAKILFEQYLDIIDHFVRELTIRANNIISEIKALDPNFKSPTF